MRLASVEDSARHGRLVVVLRDLTSTEPLNGSQKTACWGR